MLHVSPLSAAVDAMPADQPVPARALVERQIAALTRLAEMGMQIAEAATRRATASLEGEAGPGDHRDPTLAYARAARAVRMCFALQTRLLSELPALERGESRALQDLRDTHKNRIVRLVEEVARAEHGDDIERITDEAWEQLSDADELSAVMRLPLGDAVARICKDLGVSLDWSLWGEAMDLPPLGEVPAKGRGRGPQGADARASAPQPPSAALRPLPPGGEDQAGASSADLGRIIAPPPPTPPIPIARPAPPG